jgi:hypothetical protein
VADAETVLVPTEKVDPDGGPKEVEAKPQMSVAVGGEKVTAAEHNPGSLFTTTVFGQLITGFVESPLTWADLE